MAIVIKKEFKEYRLAFGTSANPLYKRTDAELVELAIMAHESKNPRLIRLFEKLPSLAELKKSKTDQDLKKIAGAATKKPGK